MGIGSPNMNPIRYRVNAIHREPYLIFPEVPGIIRSGHGNGVETGIGEQAPLLFSIPWFSDDDMRSENGGGLGQRGALGG